MKCGAYTYAWARTVQIRFNLYIPYIYVTCEFGILAILYLHRHSSAPLACWCDSVHHRMAVSSSSIAMFVSTSYKQYEMRDLELGYQWSTTTADLKYKEHFRVQEDAVSRCPVSGVDRTCHYKSSEMCGNGQQFVCSLCNFHYCCVCICTVLACNQYNSKYTQAWVAHCTVHLFLYNLHCKHCAAKFNTCTIPRLCAMVRILRLAVTYIWDSETV